MEPKNGRLVRVQGGANCYFDLESTGKYEDTLLSAESQAARRVQIVSDDGRPIAVLRVPGETRLVFGPGGPRITLAEVTHPLTPGEGRDRHARLREFRPHRRRQRRRVGVSSARRVPRRVDTRARLCYSDHSGRAGSSVGRAQD